MRPYTSVRYIPRSRESDSGSQGDNVLACKRGSMQYNIGVMQAEMPVDVESFFAQKQLKYLSMKRMS
jgi:hypothetical protein